MYTISTRFNENHDLRNLKILENHPSIFISFLRFHRSSSIRFNFLDPRRSTSRITEIEINPRVRMLESYRRYERASLSAESPRKEDLFKYMQALCAEFRDANIYTKVNLQSDGVNYAFSHGPRCCCCCWN